MELELIQKAKQLISKTDGKTYTYIALIKENEYKTKRMRDFIKKIYDGSISNLIFNLYVYGEINISNLEHFNKYYLSMLLMYFSTQKDIHVVATAKNGLEATHKITNVDVDIAIIDISMPSLDGLKVLQFMKEKLKVLPICIMLSTIGQDELTAKAMCLGARYYFEKPFEIEILAKVIRKLVIEDPRKKLQNTEEPVSLPNMNFNKDILELELKVTKMLHNIGVPAHIKGYYYLRDGIIMAIGNSEIINQITKQLYPDLSKKYKTTASRVERAIRHAIEVAWMRSKIEIQEELFGYSINSNRGKPTNSEFIAIIADNLKMEILQEVNLKK